MQPDSDKGRAKALKVAASVSGTLLLLLLALRQETKTSPNLLRNNDMEARARDMVVRGRVGDGGRREQGHAAADRRRRGRGQADEEAEEGGRGGRHPGAADSAGHGQYQQRAGTGQQYRRHAVRVPAARRHSRPERARRQPHRVPVRRRRRRAVAGRARQAAGGRLLPPPDPGPGILPPAVVADGWARRIRVRLRGGQQLRARGGAQPPRELLADDRAARPPGQCRRAARARWRRRAQLLLDIIARFFHLPFFLLHLPCYYLLMADDRKMYVACELMIFAD